MGLEVMPMALLMVMLLMRSPTTFHSKDACGFPDSVLPVPCLQGPLDPTGALGELFCLSVCHAAMLLPSTCTDHAADWPPSADHPPAVQLATLQTLDMSWNFLSGELPGSYSNLKVLRSLVLSGNNITGGRPLNVAFVSYLRSLTSSPPLTHCFANLPYCSAETDAAPADSVKGFIPAGWVDSFTSLKVVHNLLFSERVAAHH